ncbi:hypothetical protein CHS0354_010963 [Potamilus streckersoni]|uniref:DUF4832 domain-containing protein n=1 Tax=Potamilus streckersoni TaxID=2493646 RepID=A0AAE0SSX2_9BIVA|nr:hypothetical protein CHS0354_010963 [Potamilus streckersoni]
MNTNGGFNINTQSGKFYMHASRYTSKTFLSTSELFANPARGFYVHTEVKTSNYNELTKTYIVNEQNNIGGPATVGMVFRHIVLDNYVEQNLTLTVLSHIRNDLEAMKAAGVLAILRFSYTVTYNNAPPYGDGKKTTILSHIESLKPIFRDYQGVVTVVQAGFIGVWGEWYYSDHFGVPGNGLSAQNLQIQVRTPSYKYRIFGLTSTMYTDVQNHTSKSRVGHHNDCFLASSSDFGTYQNKTAEYPYLSEDTKYTVMAGETCSLSSQSRHQCSTALSELKMFHWTSMNILYNQQVIQYWKANGCFNTINQQLGYRLKLKSIVVPYKTDGTICAKLIIVNDGFAAPIRQYDVNIVLSSSSGTLYRTQSLLFADSRTWLPSSDHVITGSARLPCGIPAGLYKTGCKIPHLAFTCCNIKLKNSIGTSLYGINYDLSGIDYSPYGIDYDLSGIDYSLYGIDYDLSDNTMKSGKQILCTERIWIMTFESQFSMHGGGEVRGRYRVICFNKSGD